VLRMTSFTGDLSNNKLGVGAGLHGTVYACSHTRTCGLLAAAWLSHVYLCSPLVCAV
jgi:hypothetical protein